jgi:hypothetical protein
MYMRRVAARRGTQAGQGSGAHPHLVVDQVEDSIVGDPVQGEACQPLLQRLQQLPDWRSPREQLSEERPSLRDWSGKAPPTSWGTLSRL